MAELPPCARWAWWPIPNAICDRELLPCPRFAVPWRRTADRTPRLEPFEFHPVQLPKGTP